MRLNENEMKVARRMAVALADIEPLNPYMNDDEKRRVVDAILGAGCTPHIYRVLDMHPCLVGLYVDNSGRYLANSKGGKPWHNKLRQVRNDPKFGAELFLKMAGKI